MRSIHKGAIAVLVLVLSAVALVVPRGTEAHADAAGKGGDYVAFGGPTTVLDTRTGIGGVTGVRGPGTTTSVPVRGVGGIPASGVGAVLVDVSVISPTAATFLTLLPDGAPRPPDLSNLNAAAGQIISNSAVVPIAANGRISVYNNAGNTHITIDVQGYFTNGPTGVGGGFVPVPHTTVADTGGTPIAANQSRTFTLTGTVIPAGASAAYLNIVVTGSTASGWLAVYPVGASGSRSVIDFVSGVTSHGATVQLNAAGQVHVANHSSSAVHVSLIAQGYATANSTTGAGLRTVTAKRLLDTRTGSIIPKNGAVGVRVAGTNGLPTRGIASVVLNITTVNPASGGFLRLGCPPDMVCTPEAYQFHPSIATFPAGSTRSMLAVVPLGVTGALTIRSVSQGSLHLLVELQGWFADPLPALPIASFSRTSVMQATPNGTALGTLEYAYVDNIGAVRFGHQTDLDNMNSVQWTTVSAGHAFTGPPGLSQLSDGRLQVTAQNIDSNIWTTNQVSTTGTTWTAWTNLGGSMPTPPTVARLADGTTVLFAIDAGGKLWILRSATVGWQPQFDLARLAGSVSVAQTLTGLRLFALDTSGAVRTATYGTDGFLSTWASLGGTGMTGTPAVTVAPGFRARVVVRAADGSLVTKMQDTNGVFPTAWQSTGAFAAVGSPAVILDPVLNLTTLVARGTDNEMYRSFETAQGSGTFGPWLRIFDVSDPAATDPTVAPFTNSSGQTWMIVFRNPNDATRVYVRQAPTLAAAAAANQTPAFSRHTLPTPPSS